MEKHAQKNALGVSSGDRRADFSALNITHNERGKALVEAFHYLNKVLYEDFPTIYSSKGSILGANLVPKPTKRIPTFIIGYAQQDMEWFSEHGDGWMYYLRNPHDQEVTIKRWRDHVESFHPGVF